MAQVKPLLCFDMDGTLLHSEKAHIDSYQKALKELGYPMRSSQEIMKILGAPHDSVSLVLLPKPVTKKQLLIFRIRKGFYFGKEPRKYIRQIPYAYATLKKLKKNYKLALVSNCSRRTIEYALKTAKIKENIFDYIISTDLIHKPKPSPEGILFLAKKAKQKPLCIIGDTTYDMVAGRRAKIKTIGITQGWHTKKQLKEAKADYILKSMRELPKILENHI